MKYLFLLSFLCLFLGKIRVCYSQELPIKPARTISFTTDEGTNINVDVSPDGKTLLFDLLGDLYTVPASGGTATQLTRGMAINLQPIWSPDGKNIVYISDISGALHFNVRNLEGTFRRVLDESGEQSDLLNFHLPPIFTSDGNYVAIGDTLYGLAGGKIPLPAAMRGEVRISPDGNTGYCMDHESGSIHRYDRANNSSTTIFSPSKKLYYKFKNLTLSPDARWFAYAVDSNAKRCLIIRDLVNCKERMLVSSLAEHPLATTPHFAFSPDSKTIYIAYSGKIHRIAVDSGDDQIISFTANGKADLGPLNYNAFRVTHDSLKIKYTRSANASPDGKRLVFSTLNKLYVMDIPNGKPHILVPQPINQFQPVYSPDGKWIAYVSWCDTVGGYLWRVPASGGKPEQLTQVPGHYQRPAWSPDGKWIAVVKGGPEYPNGKLYATGKGIPKLGDGYNDFGIGQLELIPAGGGKVQAVADSVPLWNQLAFSPDGKRIIYQPYGVPQNPSFQPLLVSKELDGPDHWILAAGKVFSYPSDIQQRTISPDGRYIVYSLNEDLHLVPVCKLTDTTDIFDDTQKLQTIRFATGVDPHWENGGRVLSWSYGNKFYRVDPDKILATVEKTGQKNQGINLPEKDILTAWVTPDQVVDLDVAVPQSYAHGTIALTNARIITMHGRRVIKHGIVIIKDGHFAAVGPSSSINIPKGAKLIDCSGKTIMPGFVDLHLHFRYGTNIFPQQNWSFLINLAYGVTTARDPSTSYDSFGYAELLQSGQMIGPRLYSSGVAITPEIRVDNIDDARCIVSHRKALGGTFMKQYLLSHRIQRQWLLMASKEAGMNMTNEGEYSIALDIAMLKDGSPGIEHNPTWGDVYKDVIALFAKSGTYFTPTLQVRVPGLQYFDHQYWQQPDVKLTHFMQAAQLKDILNTKPKDTTNDALLHAARVGAQIRKQGGLVTLGSHGNNQGIGVHNELWALQMGGLSNMQALQAATIMGARAIGIQKDVGSIEVGKIADLIILNKNPLDDIHNSREIKCVMKDGILYDGDTLDEIWPIIKKCPQWKLNNEQETSDRQEKPKNLHQNSEDDE